MSANADNQRKHRVTIREIADLAGVSIATVSRVVNNRDDVASDTRQLVRRVLREHGYAGKRNARGASAVSNDLVIGLVVPRVHRVYFSAILAGVVETLHEEDIRFVLAPTLGEHERELSGVESLMHGRSDGSLLILPDESNEELEDLLDKGYRYVVVDPMWKLAERIPSVSAAHNSGADQAMRHLLDLGHRRIAAVTGPAGWLATEDRRRGYHAALVGAGIMPDPALEVEGDLEVTGGLAAGNRLFGLGDPPTAVFAFNDLSAIGVMQAARAHGLRVPEDVSIVGFDDVEYATIVTPTLTTVRQPLEEMGRTAVRMLIRLLENEQTETFHVELGTRLVVRDSTAAVPSERLSTPEATA
jgi:LacI family transcriptional regulator